MFNKSFIVKSITKRIKDMNDGEIDEMERYFYENNMLIVRDLFLEAKGRREDEKISEENKIG